MSRPSATLRALNRARFHVHPQVPHRTLAPFLYQTGTIQQWRHHSGPATHRNSSPASRADDEIPFDVAETEELPPSVDGAAASRKSTVTDPERRAFQQLYEKLGRHPRQNNDHVPFAQQRDQMFGEHAEDPDAERASLDEVFDAVISLSPLPQANAKSRRKPGRVENLKTLAEDILRGETGDTKIKSRQEKLASVAKLKEARHGEKERVMGLMDEASTDMELWGILQSEVFERLGALDLDALGKQSTPDSKGSKKDRKKKASKDADVEISLKAPTDAKSDPRILFPNYPLYLIHAVKLLRADFPASPLPLNFLPTIKSLGRSSYALGATTPLYNLLLHMTWTTHTSPFLISHLLTDMNNGGIEPDYETLEILGGILGNFKDGSSGVYGEVVDKVWGMEMTRQGVGRLRRWQQALTERLGVSEQGDEGEVWSKSVDGRNRRRGAMGPTDGFGIEGRLNSLEV